MRSPSELSAISTCEESASSARRVKQSVGLPHPSTQGDTAAMVLLGGLILENPEEAARFPQAVELFRRAAAHGNIDAEYNLGVCLRRGLGVAPDAKAAERSYRAAAERNHDVRTTRARRFDRGKCGHRCRAARGEPLVSAGGGQWQ